ncbi:MAG: MarR family transcriptional regulator [Lachnospiraceae bacterium]|nr:MarR family transcriptional regulator [Lachnospiraceae bacterium]
MDTKGGFYITQIKQLQDRIFERLLLEHGMEISGGQGRILFILWKTDKLTISEISEKTSLAKNTVSIIVNGMVQKGIVERNSNPQNRRQTIVSLTEYAKSLQAKYEAVSQQMNLLFYQGFSEEEQKRLEQYLARILETLTNTLHTNHLKARRISYENSRTDDGVY